MKHTEAPSLGNKAGFTLIELSIVLVIIGLIVGGVLVGQDLIKAAQIRATVGQLEKYNAAANTFRTKYNGLPGDLSSPASFGMTVTSAALNGNGRIESCTANDGVLFGCENAGFWNHLSLANLIEVNASDTSSTASFVDIAAFGSTNAPPAKAGRGNYILVGVAGSADTVSGNGVTKGNNYFIITAPSATTASGGVITKSDKLSPTEAYQIDTKVDDGIPTTGIAAGIDGDFSAVTTGFTTASGAGLCNNGGVYNIALVPSSLVCSMAIRTSF